MTNSHTTAHIPDAAVQAANDAYRLNYAYGKYGVAMKHALAAALPHLSAPCADKPVDVAAVLEQCAQIADDYVQYDVASAIRALSPAEPAQCQTCSGKGFVGGVMPLGQGEVDAMFEDCPDCTDAPTTEAGK